MLIQLLIILAKDIREAAEELSAGVMCYTQLQINVGFEVLNRTLSIFIPLFTAYLVHKLKRHYWEKDRPFFKHIVPDLKNWIKSKK